MKLRQGNTLNALENTRRFLEDKKPALGHVITPSVVQKVDDCITELGSVAMLQDQHTRDKRGAYAKQDLLRVVLIRDHMAPIARIATLELANDPSLVKLSLPIKRVSIQQLAVHADGMAEAARPHAQVFIDAGRKPDFIDRLKNASEQMRAAAYDAAQNRSKIKGSTSSLRQTVTRARTVVRMLDALVKEAAAGNAAILDQWYSAKRVRRPLARTTTPDGSTPAAATTVTTPTSSAA